PRSPPDIYPLSLHDALPIWLYTPGDQWYWRSAYLADISDEAIAVNKEWCERMPSWKSGTHIYNADGAAGRVANDETAWAFRHARNRKSTRLNSSHDQISYAV